MRYTVTMLTKKRDKSQLSLSRSIEFEIVDARHEVGHRILDISVDR
jgi:hypothetical protein